MKKPAMLLFDFGDTLIREPAPDFLSGWQAVFQHISKNPDNVSPKDAERLSAELWERFSIRRRSNSCRAGVEVHEWQMLRTIFDSLGLAFSLPLKEIERLLWENTVTSVPTPHVERLLHFLSENGIRTGVISNMGWSGHALRWRLKSLFPGIPFEIVLASSEYGIRKPDPLLFQIALKKASLPAGSVWFCGDNVEKDVCASHKAGLFPVWYCAGQAEDRVEGPLSFPHLVIPDWLTLLAFLQGKGWGNQ